MRLTERGATVVMDALNVTGDFATTTNGVNMKNYNRCRITLLVTASGNAAGTVTLKQGSSSTVNTALAYAGFIKNEDLTTDGAAWEQVVATTLTDAAGASGDYGYIWEVKASELDTDTFGSENTYIRLNTALTEGNVTAAVLIYEMYEPRYARSSDGMPSVA